MRWIDERYLATPSCASRRMTAELHLAVRQRNRERVQWLMRAMRLMGLEALGHNQPAVGAAPNLPLPAAVWGSIGRIRYRLPTSPKSRWPGASTTRSYGWTG